ncbi:hypothetical protein QQ045_031962 [Rhodiola kirilowii]
MRLNGIGFEKLISMGGMNVLMKFQDETQRDKVLAESGGLLQHWYEKCEPWKEEDPPKTRTTWVSIVGLPCIAWGDENFKKKATVQGHYLKMDDRLLQVVGIGRARILLETGR